jgi:hypothetical protein
MSTRIVGANDRINVGVHARAPEILEVRCRNVQLDIVVPGESCFIDEGRREIACRELADEAADVGCFDMLRSVGPVRELYAAQLDQWNPLIIPGRFRITAGLYVL